jgi:hypothetical protein
VSTWRLVIEFDWPDTFPDTTMIGGRERPKHMQDILYELLEPLNRDNVQWYDARFELVRSLEGDY